ncbi:twin-arginine translocase TatA/TatE family subunit [Bacillaceae bacterium SIJ1]|uniref:twin-arginine translocase TatA/TatE family subunit n=1 Tax=Litoribacterium kuwaitense TaxID=1398745 RepID=UPI0013EAB2E1|nr:twin-arginine translocase TatA/TatE family subunit [Litoribacterium kuwaitense]NGP46552.1 twin-arginine translocase TatA/TatE family subunit [Litoribacterium kuwaitense]
MGLGGTSIAIIAVVALLIFGPKKLPELGKAAGNTLREFKHATRGLANDEDDDKSKDKPQQAENKSEDQRVN